MTLALQDSQSGGQSWLIIHSLLVRVEDKLGPVQEDFFYLESNISKHAFLGSKRTAVKLSNCLRCGGWTFISFIALILPPDLRGKVCHPTLFYRGSNPCGWEIVLHRWLTCGKPKMHSQIRRLSVTPHCLIRVWISNILWFDYLVKDPAVWGIWRRLADNRRTMCTESLFLLEQSVVTLCVSVFSCVWLFATSQTIARQAPLSMGFSRPEYWSWVAMPSSRGSSQPRDRTHVSRVSCIGRWILHHCAIWERNTLRNSNYTEKWSNNSHCAQDCRHVSEDRWEGGDALYLNRHTCIQVLPRFVAGSLVSAHHLT